MDVLTNLDKDLTMNRIKEIRKAKRLSLEKLAEICDPPTTATQISRLEQGKRKLTQPWMQTLSKALGCEPADLLPESRRERDAVDLALDSIISRMRAGRKKALLEIAKTLEKENSDTEE